MKKNFLKFTLSALSFAIFCSNAHALLTADALELNSTVSETKVTASFNEPTTGDLYFAVLVNNELWFITEDGSKLSKTVLPYFSNMNFSNPLTLLDIKGESIPAGTYTLFQVITPAGANPLDANNWIGGSNGLSALVLTNKIFSKAKDGTTLYKDLNCVKCHGSDPAMGKMGVLKGANFDALKASLTKVSAMRYLAGTSDEDLKTLANYLKTFL